MSLRIILKPGEQLYIGSARVSVDSQSQSRLVIEGELPVVREKDYLPPEKANSTARQLYLVLQKAYLRDDFDAYRDEYFRLVGMLLSEHPEASPYAVEINSKLKEQRLYAALRSARTVVQFVEGQIIPGEEAQRWEGFD